MNQELSDQVDKRALAEQVLRENLESLRRFSYAVANDIKSPVRNVGILSDWIQKALDAGDFEKASDTVVQVKAMVGRMVGLIDGIVSYARLGETPEEA